MAKIQLPSPTMTVSKTHARRFLFAHQRLWPPRKLRGKVGILEFIRHVGCIQFDPINIVGRNPDLVLQSRIDKYRSAMLEELLYSDRQLLDGWDKVSSIILAEDWPHFSRHRQHMRERHGDPSNPPMGIAPMVLDAIRERGPLSSIDFKRGDKVDWSWGQQSSLTKASLDVLYAMGEILVHNRVGSRRIYDLAERLISPDLISTPDPNETMEDYQEWHVLRRIGGLGLANPSASELWLAMLGVKGDILRSTLIRLVERGELVVLAVDGVHNRIFFLRSEDLPTLELARTKRAPKARAALIGALDNVLWDRNLLRWIFDFEYIWEVYKPVRERKYGYYVLPILYGDRFVARVEPVFDRKERELTLKNWWWEDGVQPDDRMKVSLTNCMEEFIRYLGASHIRLGNEASGKVGMEWVSDLNLG
ncbi:MAG TPA: winged helix-turn-helix domain-containing protein [Anaerolineae bacterium]|nr:winged helix-turn-helix domain-containing protein [Anaerolineae bacterium]